MTKILYISNWKESSGWSTAARNYLLALHRAGANVVARNFNVLGNRAQLSQELLDIEAKSGYGADIVVQHVLPHFFVKHGGVKNVGFLAIETNSIKYSGWVNRINSCLDELYVFNSASVLIAKNSGVTIPVKYIPHTFDMVQYQGQFEPLKLPVLDNNFIFYCIQEFSRRKNLSAIIKAFNSEFRRNEPVSLLIKTHLPGSTNEHSQKFITNLITEIKKGLRIYPNDNNYHNEIIVTDHLSDQDILRLHASCDCFVLTSYGEAFAQTAFEAMAMGNAVVSNRIYGVTDYLKDENSYLVNNFETPCFGAIDTLNNLYTGHDTWNEVDILDLRKQMRKAYENETLRDKKIQEGINTSYEFDYQVIGQNLKEMLVG